MKEWLPIRERLTNQTPNHRLVKEGVPPMPEEGKDITEPRLTPEKTVGKLQKNVNVGEGAKEAWERQSLMPWDKVHPDVKNAFISSGAARSGPGTMRGAPEPPDSRAEAAADRLERIARGEMPPGDPTLMEPADRAGEDLTPEQERLYRSYSLYLEPQDIIGLSRDPLKWLNQQFDILYRSVQEGQELTSPISSQIQQTVGYALRFVQYHSPENLDKFQTIFIQRLNLMTMRTTIGYRNVGAIKESSIKLTAHGLMSGFGMEEGKVGSVFNRLNELLEDQRVKAERGHITPEIVNKLQDNVIQEQLRLAERGIGDFVPEGRTFGELSDEEKVKVRADIVRATRIAYDTFVDSQRQAIIVARGQTLLGTEGYFSDPSSGPLNVYNLEALLTEKFDILNQHDYEFLDKIKLDLAEGYIKDREALGEHVKLNEREKLDLGKRLFRDLFAVPDFFSSGWRIEGILSSIEERMMAVYGEGEGRARAKEFGLFLRLRDTGTSAKDKPELKREIWAGVAKFRPEEIVRLFRDRGRGVPRLEDRYNALFGNEVFTRNGVTNYDQFKDKYGAILRQLREEGFKEFRQLNIAEEGFTDEEISKINRFIGSDSAASELREMFVLMTAFGNGSIDALLSHNKFEDIYTRTINADDALLAELENTTLRLKTAEGQEIEIGEFVPLSKKWAADQGGDALVRNWNDTENAVKAAHALIQFIKQEDPKEKLKSAIEFAEATSQYNGQAGRAKTVRYTFGTFLNLSKKDYFWDVVGFNKGLFRKPISDIERIYGPSAKAMSRHELRGMVDEINLLLVAQLSKKAREGLLTPAEFETESRKAQLMYKDLEELTEITGKDFAKLAFFKVLLFLILEALVAEPYKMAQSVAKGKAA